MALDLLKRRSEVAAHNKTQEETRGSGWHAHDFSGNDKRGMSTESKLTERPIMLQHGKTVYFVGPDVATIKAGCQKFLDKLTKAQAKAKTNGWPEPDLVGHGTNYQAQVVEACTKVKEAPADKIELFSQEWNYANHALTLAGILVSSATAEIQSYEDC